MYNKSFQSFPKTPHVYDHIYVNGVGWLMYTYKAAEGSLKWVKVP